MTRLQAALNLASSARVSSPGTGAIRCHASCASSTVALAARHFVSSARLPIALLASAERSRSASSSVADLFDAARGLFFLDEVLDLGDELFHPLVNRGRVEIGARERRRPLRDQRGQRGLPAFVQRLHVGAFDVRRLRDRRAQRLHLSGEIGRRLLERDEALQRDDQRRVLGDLLGGGDLVPVVVPLEELVGG